MFMFKKIAVLGCTLLLLAACNSNQEGIGNGANNTNIPNNNYQTNPIQNPTQGSISVDFDVVNPKVTFSEALKIFNDIYPNANIESVDLETGYGRLYYDIEGFDQSKEYELKIDPMTKEIDKKEFERTKGTDEILDLSNVMDPSEAIAIASQVRDVQGLSPIGWSLDAEYGMQIYKVEFRTKAAEIDVKIDAKTGEILKVDVDD
ncbi:hypothetical protein FKZ59_09760 [Ureibacillus terrenus]|uniref:PepSY domain-containing protein n=2 Tax=Ureibacillus terrenus TaxID=118246 RepID=A0A540V1G1_9BACL|nr:hypothetical protein FKZ59_09760 [Ureibacillus terrenus]